MLRAVHLCSVITSVLLLNCIIVAVSSRKIFGYQSANMRPGRTMWKRALRARESSSPPAEPAVVAEVAKQLRTIGDKYNLAQKMINAVVKIMSPGT